jgi:hypothetical protein
VSSKSQVVIITGAGNGIGKAIAGLYASKGFCVVIADVNDRAGTNTANEITASGGKSLYIRTDVSNPSDIVSLFDEVSREKGRADILVNNAGISKWKSPLEITVEEWDELINTNLRGAFLCSRAAAAVMRDNGGGSIVNIASTRAFMSEPDSEAYAASKGGVVALTHAMAASFAKFNIRVNCISPGWIETGDYLALRPEDHSQHFSGRVGKPEDVARLCVYVTANGSEFLNGANIILDGGMTRKMIYEP